MKRPGDDDPASTWNRLQAAMERVRATRGTVARRRALDAEIAAAPDLEALLEPMLEADAKADAGGAGGAPWIASGGRSAAGATGRSGASGATGADAVRGAGAADDGISRGSRLAVAESLLDDIRRTGGVIELPAGDHGEGGSASTDPDTIAHYRLGPVIGQGASGLVHRAEDVRPEAAPRVVALKRIIGGFGPRPTRRLIEREAALLRRLDHPGIARWIDAGVSRERGFDEPWIAMELVDGVPITRWAAARGLEPPAILRLVAEVADALAHAHERGVVHRDLKAANILVDADGRSRILDFGAARLEDPGSGDALTRTGVVVGTVGSMAPEQFEAVPERIGPRADIYALGVLAYRLLSGRLPFEVAGRPLADAARVICDEDPSSLGSRDRRLRGPVDHVVATAMAREPSARYSSAAALAEDLRRAADGQPVIARPPSVGTQMRRLVRRHRRVAAGVALTVAGLLVVASLAVVAAVGAERLRREEVRSRQDAEQREATADALRLESDRLRAEAEHQSAVANVALAGAALRSGNAAEARRRLGTVDPQRRGWAWTHIHGRTDRAAEPPVAAPPADSRSAPVGLVVLGPDRWAVADRAGTVGIVDGPRRQTFDASVRIRPRGLFAGRSPDELFVFGGGGVERVDVRTRVATRVWGDGVDVVAAAMSPDSVANTVVAVTADRRVHWIDTQTGDVRASTDVPSTSGSADDAWSTPPELVTDRPGEGVLLQEGERLIAFQWRAGEPPTARVLWTEKLGPARRVAVGPWGKLLAVVGGDGRVIVRSRDGRVLEEWKASLGRVVDVLALDDGSLVTLTATGLSRWTTRGERLWTAPEPTGRPLALADLGGHRILSLAGDRSIRVIDLDAPVSPVHVPTTAVATDLVFVDGRPRIVVASDGRLTVRSTHDGRVVPGAAGTSDAIDRIAMIGADAFVAGERLARWDRVAEAAGQRRWSVDLGAPVRHLAVADDGRSVFAWTAADELVQVDGDSGSVQRRGTFGPTLSDALLMPLPGGDVVLGGRRADGDRMRLVRVGAEDWSIRWRLDQPSHPPTDMTMLPGGAWRPAGVRPPFGSGPLVAIASRAGAVLIVDVDRGERLSIALPSVERAPHVAVLPGPVDDPSAWRLVVAESERLVHIIRPGDEEPEATLIGREAPVVHLAVAPDGHAIVLACADGTLEVLSREPPVRRGPESP